MTDSAQRLYGCVLLIALPFVIMALVQMGGVLAVAAVSYQDVFNTLRLYTWDAVPAQIDALEFLEQPDTTAKVRIRAVYHYIHDGQTYLDADTISPDFTSDEPRWLQERIYAQLDAEHNTPQGVVCYVNPDKPKQAILRRNMYWPRLAITGMVAPAQLGLCLAILWWINLHIRTRPAAQSEYGSSSRIQDKSDRGIHHRTISARTRVPLPALWALTLFWCSFSIPVLFFAFADRVSLLDPRSMLFLAQPCIGVLLIGYCIWKSPKLPHLGTAKFHLSDPTVLQRGALRGQIEIPGHIQAKGDVQVSLTCLLLGNPIARRVTRTIHRSTYSYARPPGFQPFATIYDILLPIPSEAPSLDGRVEDPKFLWLLTIRLGRSSASTKYEFEIPIGDARAPEPHLEVAAEWLIPEPEIRSVDLILADNNIFVEKRADNAITIRMPAPRNRTSALLFLSLGVLFMGVSALLAGSEIEEPSMLYIVGFIGAACALSGVLSFLRDSEVSADAWGVEVYTTILGMGFRRHYRTADINRFSSASNTKINNQPYYSLFMHLENGRVVALAHLLPGIAHAERFIAHIEDAIYGPQAAESAAAAVEHED